MADLADATPGDELADDGREEQHGGHERRRVNPREQPLETWKQRQVRRTCNANHTSFKA